MSDFMPPQERKLRDPYEVERLRDELKLVSRFFEEMKHEREHLGQKVERLEGELATALQLVAAYRKQIDVIAPKLVSESHITREHVHSRHADVLRVEMVVDRFAIVESVRDGMAGSFWHEIVKSIVGNIREELLQLLVKNE